MNTNNIKKYAPQARREFMDAVGKRLNQFGIYNKGKTLTISEPTFSGSVMQIDGNSFDAGLAQARKRLTLRAEQRGFEPLVEHVAYTWFNRLCAIRFMELKGDYLEHGLRVLSPSPSQGESRGEGIIPEILDHAQDVAEQLNLDRNAIVELKLAGNKDEELYRHLLLGQCHQLHEAMPFLFEALDDETELLLPDNLTRTDSILRGLVDSIPEDDWQPVEIIGWLYQFYISEKKDQVIGNVVKSEDIPAATQLFTPNWIVKYLVQNSVGRQWLMTYPDSGLKTQMAYYIEPAEQELSVGAALAAITPASIEPESIKVIDPACGSGHILVEAYDLLKAIYEERGYRSRDIPKLILEHNLVGLDIDDRAAQLAGFALMMKAREDDRRIFSRELKLNVLALQSSHDLNLPELWRKLALNKHTQRGTTESIFDDAQTNLLDAVDDADFTALADILALFEHAKTFGSLIQVPADKAAFLQDLNNQLQPLLEHGDNYQKSAATVLLPFVQQAWLLAQRYDAVIANPPYMGGKGMNPALKEFAKKHFPDSKSDLFAMFIERGFAWCKASGFNAQVTMQSWMFLSSYQAMREKCLSHKTLNTMAHLGARAFSEISGEVVQTTAFVFHGNYFSGYKPAFFRLVDGNEEQKQTALLSGKNRFDKTVQDDFKRISGSPVAYWVSDKAISAFSLKKLNDLGKTRRGLQTGEKEKFIRKWFECSVSQMELSYLSKETAIKSKKKWFMFNNGGESRRWYGNLNLLVNWAENGTDIKNFSGSIIPSEELYFEKAISWLRLTSGEVSFTLHPKGLIPGDLSPCYYAESDFEVLFGLLNSKCTNYFLTAINPTVTSPVGDVAKLPVPLLDSSNKLQTTEIIKKLIQISKTDWNNYETSWDFTENPLIRQQQNTSNIVPTLQRGNAVSNALALRDAGASPDEFPRRSVGTMMDESVGKKTCPPYAPNNLEHCFTQWQTQNRAAIEEMQRLEQENNRLFIDAYGLQDELSPEVPEEQITLTRADREKDCGRLISYAIGCMMGRYSLDEAGLIYAHAGNVDFDPIRYPTFPADEDGILPLTDQEWFKDDTTNRFREFLAAVWGEDTLQQNLLFVAESLTLSSFKTKKGENNLDTVRRYLSNQFYKDHLQTYKKRPIYWLFSSGKQKAFECLVYLHRYNESTLPRMRTEYVTPLLGKYDAFAGQLNKKIEDATTSEAVQLKKDLAALEKKQTELREFDDKLKHYADMRIKLDLDDGVKVNYGKFGDLLAEVKAVTGSKENS